MRVLVVLAVVGVCSAVPFIQDTPEVAAEKARFFQAYRAAQAAATSTHQYNPQQAYTTTNLNHYSQKNVIPQQATYQVKWTGPLAATVPAGINGAVIPVGDTPEVSAARQAFVQAYQAQLSATVGAAPTQYTATTQWNTVPAHAPSHAVVPAHVPVHSWPAPVQVPAHTWAAPAHPRWTGPVAATVPAGLPGSTSQVVDTPEVQAAKAAFFQTYQRQAAAAAAASPTYTQWG
ncbi:hypothetical protein SK128_009544 [Halocaridina rubra]|uniref:Uncharacterized protein n=1 Tax=Halocaridina rubra TaxID=373956 RepID=A0AAN9FUG4_HALRR